MKPASRQRIGASPGRRSWQALVAGDPELAARILGAALAVPGSSRDELAPREQSALDRLLAELKRRDGATEIDALTDAGAALSQHELAAAIATLPGGAQERPSTAPEADPPPATPWREQHRAALEHMESAWGLEDDVHVYRGLGGKSGATVLAVDVTTSDFSGQAILKLEDGDWSEPAEIEAERHEQAWANAPEFAERHMPRVVHRGRWGRSSALLATIAARGLEYTVPWAEAHHTVQLDVGQRMASALLSDWNADYRLAPSIVSPQSLPHAWLDYRLDPERGRIHGLLEDHGVEPGSATYIHDGQWYPNALAFSHDEAAGEKRGLRPIVGNTHGDLHGFNVLVRTGVDEPSWFLIDLAFYEPAGYLFFDHAYFELAHLLEARSDQPLETWVPLIEALDGGAELGSDDYGLVELLRALRATTWAWVEARESDRVSSMQSQIMLARVAVGLNFAHKRVPDALKTRGFLFAGASLKEYIKLHDIDWPRSGPSLRGSPR
jgi:hypothetical protein